MTPMDRRAPSKGCRLACATVSGEAIRFDLLVRADTDKDAESVEQMTRAVMKDVQGKVTQDKNEAKKPVPKAREALWQVADALLTKYELKRSGTTVHLQTGTIADFADLLFAASTGELGLP